MILIFDFDIKAVFSLKIQECSIAWIDALFPSLVQKVQFSCSGLQSSKICIFIFVHNFRMGLLSCQLLILTHIPGDYLCTHTFFMFSFVI